MTNSWYLRLDLKMCYMRSSLLDQSISHSDILLKLIFILTTRMITVSPQGASTSRVLGAIVRFTCPKGFNQHGPEKRECLAAGSWGGADPSCVKQSCGTPKAPAANGKVSAPKGHTVGESAVYSCDTGYQLKVGEKKVPDVTISCEAATKAAPGSLGRWSGPAPTCTSKELADPPCEKLHTYCVFYERYILMTAYYSLLPGTIRTCGTLPPVEVTGPNPVNGQSKTKVPTRKDTTGKDGKADTFGATATLGCTSTREIRRRDQMNGIHTHPAFAVFSTTKV